MSDSKKDLAKLYSSRDRYTNFGAMLNCIIIRGFRSITDLKVQFDSPVTAITGLNGTGKSTIAQLCMSAYKKPSTEKQKYKRQYIKDYFPVSSADPKPFRDEASVVYKYLTNDNLKNQELTISRSQSQWEGYKRQPDRHCRYIGFTIYIPKVEQRDISIYKGTESEINNEEALSEVAIKAISKILSNPYDELSQALVTHKSSNANIGFAKKYGAKYSENNMGFGEGRVFYIVSSLESAPEQSLFVIEEPETSLHEHAQYEIAKYFIDVAVRRKHQIILTTHSAAIINALPRESRKLLYREGAVVKISDKTSTAEATGLLSRGFSKNGLIIVEDIKAKQLLIEILRKYCKDLLKGVSISFVGNDDVVRNIVGQLRLDSIKAIGIRDGDKGECSKEYLFKLPGSKPPEKEVIECADVKRFLNEVHGFSVDDFLRLNEDMDFHEWPETIAAEIFMSESSFWENVCRIYIETSICTECEQLIESIKRNVG